MLHLAAPVTRAGRRVRQGGASGDREKLSRPGVPPVALRAPLDEVLGE